MLATIGGETQFTVMSSLLAGPQVEAGKLRALAIGSLKRDPHFPDMPTLRRSGLPRRRSGHLGRHLRAGRNAA